MVEAQRTWAEISMDKLESNFVALKGLTVTGTKFLALVKANAYGHGAVPVAKKLEELGVDYLGVACMDEAVELREAGVKAPILILGVTALDQTDKLIHYNISQACYNLDYAKGLSKIAAESNAEICIHIQCDTGMTRLGFQCDPVNIDKSEKDIIEAVNLPGLKAEGIFTHFSDSDGSEEYTIMQFERFQDIIQRVEASGFKFEIHHCANSAATLRYPFTHLDMIRPGIVLYGYYPVPEIDSGLCNLSPVMTLKTRVGTVRTVPENTAVSYGRTNTTKRETRLAVLPIGYADGFSRLLSNKFNVMLHGKPAPIFGRICMDMCMADVTDIPEVQEGDIAILYGGEGENYNPIEQACDIIGTISNELVCALTPRVKRKYI